MPAKKKPAKEVILTKAFIMSDGRMVKAADIQKSMEASKEAESQSKQLSPEFEQMAEQILEPSYDPKQLATLLEKNTHHARCVAVKATDISGRGYQIVEDETFDGKPSEEDQKTLEAFFRECSDEIPFNELMTRIEKDEIAIGNAYLELGRDATGKPKKFWHLPVASMRVLKQNLGFVQKVAGKTIYFQRYGEKYERQEKTLKVKALMDPATGQVSEGLDWQKAANEVIHLKNYNPTSSVYGVPDIVPAMSSVYGNACVHTFSIKYLENGAVPRYVVIVKGADLSPEIEQAILSFFHTNVDGNSPRTLLIPIPFEDVTVTVQAIPVDWKPETMGIYRQANRDEVIQAHGVHPARIGIIETASLGSGTGLSQNETYKATIVEPAQARLEHIFNRIIRDGFGITGWLFKFADIDLRDHQAEANKGLACVQAGTISINEFRENYLQLKPLEAGGDKPFLAAGGAVMMISDVGKPPEEQATEAVKEAEKALAATTKELLTCLQE